VSKKNRPPQPFRRGTSPVRPNAAIVETTAGGEVLTVNAEQLPRPPRVYNANVAWAVRDSTYVSIFFGERWPGERKLGSAVFVKIPSQAIGHALYSGDTEFVSVLSNVAHRLGIMDTAAIVDPECFPSFERRATEHAGIMAIAYADMDASIRLYRVSAPELRRFRTDKDVEFIMPIVEVVLSTGLLAGLVERLASLVPHSGLQS
jgi:hypothetical protein